MSSSAQDAIPQLELGNTFGALFIGVILAAVLFGLTNVQAFIYLQAHRNAGITFFKLVITWLWIFDALHLALTIHCVYYYLVTNYANFGVLTEIVWSLKLQLVISALIVPMVQLLYVHRIWKISEGRSRVLPAISLGMVLVLISGEFVASLAWEQCRVKFFKDLAKTMWSIYLCLGAATSTDIIITSLLCYLLATSRTGFSCTDSFITKLVGYTVSTGCLTSIFSVSIIITCAVMPTTFIFIGLPFLVTKLYVNSFIALLNARYYMQANAIVDPPQLYEHHGVYHQELHTSGSQDEEFHKSQGDPKDEVLHITQPIQGIMPQPTTSTMEMKSPSSLV
ncbi:uncharacterized protein F5891DRAFT_763632 [Suillus fuscotomentosus]|uniref:DUF6534 domain-containing protein n=1 Tax=Suillus fuscotomentosus TaxID=1912939 RepID=A0AAD4DVT1_9AGAM|nr:uncharacterized protein F5891DRAFT_763632 [Suillus fuscotomentosus]KAG1893809.1 hypothetical protein F5891DRAFT_763632 [Suillus fuscotomentosus]